MTDIAATTEMLDAYTRFGQRIHNERENDEERLLLLANMMDYVTKETDADQLHQSVVYWPRENVTLGALSCMVRDTVCLESATSRRIQFAVNPLSYFNTHTETPYCCKYCHFTGSTRFTQEDFIPASFVASLFRDLKNRRRRHNTGTQTPAATTTRKRLFSDVHDSHTIKVSTTGTSIAAGIPCRTYSHCRRNDDGDFRHGYTMTGALEGNFALDMRHIKGIVGVSPIDATTPYSVIVSLSALVRLEHHSPDRFTEITFLSPLSLRTTTIAYNALHHGLPLSSLIEENDGSTACTHCRIDSNDALIFMFDTYATHNRLAIESVCRCRCNVDFALYALWYQEGESLLPIAMHINTNEFTTAICRDRINSGVIPVTVMQHTIPKARSTGAKVNATFDEYGSMETYFDVIDLITRIKITDTNVKSPPIPEFYITSTPISVRQLRRTTGMPSTTTTNIPQCNISTVIPPDHPLHISNRLHHEEPLLWSIFHNGRALALFNVHDRCVSLTPITPGERFEVVNYVVY